MKIAITGGLGFIGQKLTEEFLKNGENVTIFARSGNPELTRAPFGYVRCDLTEEGEWQKALAGHDAVINLAGTGIFTRWNRKIKENIYNSRIVSTANIVKAISDKNSQVRVFVNASAVGYYGLTGNREIGESDPPGEDFLAMVCRHWEEEAMKADNAGVRVALMRLGTVFGQEGGAFPLLKRVFMRMLGARLGSGKQWFPWIHIDDAVAIMEKTLKDKAMSGPFNCTAPGIVTNRQFTAGMKEATGRPQLIPFVPVFALRIALGEFGQFLAGGQKAVPERLVRSGYNFRFADLNSALVDLLK